MEKLPILRKDDRYEYPNLKTVTELRKIKLMPSPKGSPRAIYRFYTPFDKKRDVFLYDISLTQPLKR